MFKQEMEDSSLENKEPPLKALIQRRFWKIVFESQVFLVVYSLILTGSFPRINIKK